MRKIVELVDVRAEGREGDIYDGLEVADRVTGGGSQVRKTCYSMGVDKRDRIALVWSANCARRREGAGFLQGLLRPSGIESQKIVFQHSL